MANQHDLCIQHWLKHVLYDSYANIKGRTFTPMGVNSGG